ncbi:halocyanin domain-containing protein [Halorubrum vacuolatum]|uniref:Halocyanin domain-containing protein n=1 Tax=Halorubrum vacuolatum TaxID=63740 RepID=A0A238X1Z0_HALVU|nr:halocyanin domain-containing protein [Halorubrum vacuolatum]SNR51859.1 halocyanin domain-containing protein [Halorubrum vacuolatum]
MSQKLSRRRYVAGTGAVMTLGALAGCAGDDGNDAGDPDDGAEEAPAEIDEFLADARLYDGTIADHTGEDQVEVAVGGGDDGLAFDPAAIRIDAGTTVRWEWTGAGGEHNVESDEGSVTEFSSGDAVAEEGETYEYTFEDEGNVLYVCTPHIGVGMLGAIEVV